MKKNHIYAGSPAKDITNKIGKAFEKNSIDSKYEKMINYLEDSKINSNKIKIIKEYKNNLNSSISYFNVKERTYTKRLSKEEILFMKFLLPDK